MKILALDLGKSKSVACDYESTDGCHEFETISTESGALRNLLTTRRPQRVVIEVCPLAGWVSDLICSLGIELQVANPTHEGWRWRNVKRKTDRLDALKLAQLSAMNQLPTVRVPERTIRQWRSLISYRHALVTRRTAVKNRIRAILVREGLRAPSGRAGWTNQHRRQMDRLAKPVTEVSAEELWHGELHEELRHLDEISQSVQRVEERLDAIGAADPQVKLVRSIPGVGPRLSEIVVAAIDDPGRFQNAKQVASYAGLVPRQYQSGAMNRQGRISGQGNKLLRSLLVEVSWLGLRHNPWMKEVFDQVCRGIKTRRKLAIVAVARRLLIRCWAILRDQRPWAPSPPSQPVAG